MITQTKDTDTGESIAKNSLEGTMFGSQAHLTIAGQVAAMHGGFSDAEFADLEKIYDKLINHPDNSGF